MTQFDQLNTLVPNFNGDFAISGDMQADGFSAAGSDLTLGGRFRGVLLTQIGAPTGGTWESNDWVISANGDGTYSIHVATVTITNGASVVTWDAGVLIAPSAVTNPATSVAQTTASLNGVVNPRGRQTTYQFHYGLDTAYGLGTTAVAQAGAGIVSVPVAVSVTGLPPGSTIHFAVFATNSAGTVQGVDQTFQTPQTAAPPLAVTVTPTGVQSTAATLIGSVNPNGLDTLCHFEWGTTTGYGTSTSPAGDVGSGGITIAYTFPITGLSASTTYHYRLVAVSSAGTTNGSDQSFTTLAAAVAPTVTENAASAITNFAVTISGTINPNSFNVTTAVVDWGTTTSYGSTVALSPSPGAQNVAVAVSGTVSGLTPGTAYHFRIRAVNANGTTNGTDIPVTTTGGTTATAARAYAQNFWNSNGSGSPPTGANLTAAYNYMANNDDIVQLDGGPPTNVLMPGLATAATAAGNSGLRISQYDNMWFGGQVTAFPGAYVAAVPSDPIQTAWMLKTTAGANVIISGLSATTLPDFRNPSYLAWKLRMLKYAHDHWAANAYFIDDCWPLIQSFPPFFNSMSGIPTYSPFGAAAHGTTAGTNYSNANFAADFYYFYSQLKAALVSAGYDILLVANSVWYGAAYASGAKAFFNTGFGPNGIDFVVAEGYMTQDLSGGAGFPGTAFDETLANWVLEVQMGIQLETNGGAALLGWSHTLNYRTPNLAGVSSQFLYFMGTYLMGAGVAARRSMNYYDWTTGLTPAQTSIYYAPIHPYFNLPTGDPISVPGSVSWTSSSAYCNPNVTSTPNYVGAGYSCWRRDYSNSIVLVNANDNATSNVVPLPAGTWYDATGAVVTSVTLTNSAVTGGFIKNGAIVCATHP